MASRFAISTRQNPEIVRAVVNAVYDNKAITVYCNRLRKRLVSEGLKRADIVAVPIDRDRAKNLIDAKVLFLY